MLKKNASMTDQNAPRTPGRLSRRIKKTYMVVIRFAAGCPNCAVHVHLGKVVGSSYLELWVTQNRGGDTRNLDKVGGG